MERSVNIPLNNKSTNTKYIMKITFTIIIGLLALFAVALHAQNGNITLAGIVMTESGEEMIGVSVVVKENQGHGTVTDMDGRFRLNNLSKGRTLVFSYIGYDNQEIHINSTDERLRIVMKETASLIDEVVVVGRGTQRKVSVTGAVTNVEVSQLQVPSSSVTNMLGGRIPGIIAVTRSGEPGNDFSEFWVRGISTFGAGSSALVLIDGVQGNLNDLDPADIESFSILKDASATAVYGMKGANGVVLVTTKRGVAGKLKVEVKSNVSLSRSGRTPNYVDAHSYARLANEARMVRDERPIYTDAELRLFETNLDPDLYPNVDWQDVILRDYTWNQQHHLSASGGGQAARYYMSLGIQTKDAIFKQDKGINKYDTNVNYNKYNFRANVDINMTSTTNLILGLETIIVNQNFPGYSSNNDDADGIDKMWTSMAGMTPVTVPLIYSTGELPGYGRNSDQQSPYVQLNHTGYQQYYRNTNKLNVQFAQDLSMITKGLSFTALFHMTSNSDLTSHRSKQPALYYATGRKRDGSLDTKVTVEGRDPGYSRGSTVDRTYYFETRGIYERIFGTDHRVTGLINFNLEDKMSSIHGSDLTAIPKRYVALSARATYSFKDTYVVEGNFGYTGSEAFAKGKKFGTFPAVSFAWVPSQYKFVTDNLPFIDFFKIRLSYGVVGNDKLTWDDSVRFPYLTIMNRTAPNSNWGGWKDNDKISEYPNTYWDPSIGIIREDQVGATNLRWEKSQKYNLGIDLKLFNQRIDLVMDFFKDVRSGIFQQRASVPEEMGLASLPWANVGKMKSWGMDGSLSYTQPFNKDTYLVFRTNLTLSKNKVLAFEESTIRYPYQTAVGYEAWIKRGLIAEGLFRDEEDIANSPLHTFSQVRPGDIKYRDVNGDGKIDVEDEVPLKHSDNPGLNYGFAAEFNWKNWNINIFFEGLGRLSHFYGGAGYYPFYQGSIGNVLDIVADQKNRWTPASYSGDPATENPNARFPRLTYGDNPNNNRQSTFWMVDGDYLRLKNVQISYTLKNKLFNRIGLDSAIISFIGDNLHVWDKVKLYDPAQFKDQGRRYPIQRVYTLQAVLKF